MFLSELSPFMFKRESESKSMKWSLCTRASLGFAVKCFLSYFPSFLDNSSIDGFSQLL